MSAPAPLLLVAVGNPSRGDDGLGPALLDRLHARGVEAVGDVELLTEFQLQIEHALDLASRRAVLFVDAAWPGAADGVSLCAIGPSAGATPFSHALPPQAVLRVAVQLEGRAPPAWSLAIEGRSFELGAPLSAVAERNLVRAEQVAVEWLAQRRADA